MLGGDPSQVRRAAAEARRLAGEVWAECAGLGAATSGQWRSGAGERYRLVLADRTDDVRRVAERYDHVADRLTFLADTLESRQRAVLAAFEAAKREFDEAVDAVEDGAEKVWDYAGDVGGFVKDHAWPW